MQAYEDDDAVVDDGPYDVHGGVSVDGEGGDSGWGAGSSRRDKLRNMGAQLGGLGKNLNVKDLQAQLKENPEKSALVGALVVVAVLCCVCIFIVCCLGLCAAIGWFVAATYIVSDGADTVTRRPFDDLI